MPIKFDKLEQFQKSFKPAYDKVTAKDSEGKPKPIPLTKQEMLELRPVIADYYTYLKENGNTQESNYGNLALGVVNGDSTSGKVANAHMEANALHKGFSQQKISTMKDGVQVYLVANDVQMRMDTLSNSVNNPASRHISKIIPEYHYAAFEIYDCGKLCWTGATFHKFAGDSTAWYTIATGDASTPKMELGKIYDAYRANTVKDGFSAVDAVNSLARTISHEADLNSASHQIIVGGHKLNVIFESDWPDVVLMNDYTNTASFRMLPTAVRNILRDLNKAGQEFNLESSFHAGQDKTTEGERSDTCRFNHKLAQQETAHIYKKEIFQELEKLPNIKDLFNKQIVYNFEKEPYSYVIKSGDTVWEIANQYGVSVDQLTSIPGNEFLKENRVKSSKGEDYILIMPGQEINVPAVSDPNNKQNDQVPRDVRANARIKNALETFEYATTFKSPLVLDLNGYGIELSHVHDNPVFFDIDGDGHLEKIGWLKPSNGHLAMDRNGNGQIDDIKELYGDDVMPAFSKLALHDENEDGMIDEKDRDYDKILVWRDFNQNGVSEPRELKTLREIGIKSISLHETKKEEFNEDNLITGTSEFTWLDGKKGEVADVHYVNDKVNSWYVGRGAAFTPVSITSEVLSLPNSRGYGKLPSLHIAMSHNHKLLDMVKEFSDLKPEKWDELLPRIEDILFEWAGSAGATNSRFNTFENNIGADKIGFLEKFTGQTYHQVGNKDLLGPFAQKELHKAFYSATYNIKMNLLVQGPLKELFPGTTYKLFRDKLVFSTTKHEIAKLVVALSLSQPENYLAPDLFNSLLTIVFDEQNNIELKEFSIENVSHSLLGDSKMEAFTELTRDVFQKLEGDFKHELERVVVVTKFAADMMNLVSKTTPTAKERFDEQVNIFAEEIAPLLPFLSDFREKNDSDSFLPNIISEISRYFNLILEPSEKQTKILFKALVNMNNAIILNREYDSYSNIFQEFKAGALRMLTEGSDMIDLSDEEGLRNVVVYAKGGDDLVRGSKTTRNMIFGGKGNDWLSGGDAQDCLEGGGGNDFLFGQGGNDILKGGDGNDFISGGYGADQMDGGSGNDTLEYDYSIYLDLSTGEAIGLLDDIKIVEKEGPYIILGEAIELTKDGNLSLLKMITPETNEEYKKFKDEVSDLKKEFIEKAKGHDVNYLIPYAEFKGYLKVKRDTFVNFENIQGSVFDDVLIGDEQNNRFNGEKGDDYIEGRGGDDSLYGADGNDKLFGGEGDDRLNGGEGADYIDGEGGFDTADYASFYSTDPVYVNLKTGEGKGGEAEGDKLVNIQGVRGSRFDDILVGNHENNVLRGEEGDDILFGNGGDDLLIGGKGRNTYVIKSGQEGEVKIYSFGIDDKIVFIGYTPSEQSAIENSIFKEYGIAPLVSSDGISCTMIDPYQEYYFNLEQKQTLRIYGDLDNLIILHFEENQHTKVMCESNFIFLNSIEEMDQTVLKGYDIFE